MIKRYTQFVKEEMEETVPVVSEGEVDDDTLVCIKITQEEENLFNTEPILQSLVDQRKITYQHGEMCYPKDDQRVIDICKSFFKSVGVNESKRINEMRHNEESHEQLAKDAFEAGQQYQMFLEDKKSLGDSAEIAPDFNTWWSNYSIM